MGNMEARGGEGKGSFTTLALKAHGSGTFGKAKFCRDRLVFLKFNSR